MAKRGIFILNGKRTLVGSSLARSKRVVPTSGTPPALVTPIPDLSFTQGTGARTINLNSYFSGSALSFAISSVAGVSLSGAIVTIADGAALTAADVTVTASNAFGANATDTFAREVTAPAAAGAITLTEVANDEQPFGLGSAAGINLAQIPFAGTADAGAIIQGRVVSLDDFGLTGVDWTDIATVGGGGTWSGTLDVPFTGSRLRREARYKTTPATTAVATKTVVVAHTGLFLGQSEQQRVRTYTNNMTTETMITAKDAVQQLAAPARVGALTPSAQQRFVVGIDTLPTGLTRSGNTVSVNGSTYDGAPLRYWDFPDHKIQSSAPNFVMQHCKLQRISDASIDALFRSVLVSGAGGFKELSHNEFLITEGLLGISAAIHSDHSGSGAGVVVPTSGRAFRNHFRGMPTDCIKPTGGYWYENLIVFTWNVPGVPPAWNAGVVYALGDFVKYNNNYFTRNSGWAFGNQPPSGQTSGNGWTSWNPHCDTLSPNRAIVGGAYFARNLILADFARTNGNTLDGINNDLARLVRDPQNDTNRYDLVLLEENVVVHEATKPSAAIQASSGGGANYTAPVIRGNWLAQGAGEDLYSAAQVAGIEWSANKRLADGSTITAPAGTTAGSYTSHVESAVVMSWHVDAAISNRRKVNSANRESPGYAAMANFLISEAPGHRFDIGHAAESGTGFHDLANDNLTERVWADFVAFLDYMFPHGRGALDLVSLNWQANDQALGLNYADVYFPILTGKKLSDGSTIVPPQSEGGKLIHHTFAEIMDFARTRTILWGPGARQPEEDMVNALTRVTGSPSILPVMQSYGRIRTEVRVMIASPYAAGRILPEIGTESMDVYCAAVDGVHPSAHDDGLPKFARYMALSLLNGWGLTPNLTPKITNSGFSASFAEFWSSAGPITTPRIKRGLAAIPATFPHRTAVFSWEIDTGAGPVPARSATIVAGRIRVAPISGSFAAGHVFAFGRGGATGIIEHPDDPVDRSDLNYPIVDFGHWKLDGLPVQAVPASALMTMP